MADISLIWDNNTQSGDFQFTNSELATGDDLYTAVIISLLTDRRANADYTPTDGTNDRRGVWFDTYQPFLIGSRLWQLNRAAISGQSTLLLQARDMCNEALQWLLTYGIAASVNVQTSWLTSNALGISIMIQRPNQSSTQSYNFTWAWNQIGLSAQ